MTTHNKVCLDSNIILLNHNNIFAFNKDTIIVLPETVLQECDSKKGLMTEIGYQARSFGRLLIRAKVTKVDKGPVTTTTLEIDNTTIEVVALDKYRAVPGTDKNDQKIIEVAEATGATLITNDVLCRLRALALGLKTADLKVVERINYEFVKDYQIDDYEVFRNLHNTMIHEVDKDYKLENYSYRFTNSMSGQVKLASITNGVINILGKETEDKLRRQNCPPIGAEQLLASRAILDPTIDLVVIEGTSGSGKNTIAVSSLMRLMSTAKKAYDKIVYIRNPVDDIGNPDEEIGFLAGNDEKQDVYLGPMEDTLQFIARNKLKKKPSERSADYEDRISAEIIKLTGKYGIESRISLGLRGRTFRDALVILDEFQNAGAATTQKVLTRIGENCKVVMLGSMNQIDSKYLTRFNNGLAAVMDEAANGNVDSDINMFAITLTKTKRSAMCDFAEKLFEERK